MRIDSLPSSNTVGLVLGVSRRENHSQIGENRSLFLFNKRLAWGYGQTGHKYHSESEPGTKYGAAFKAGDVVEVQLDLDKKTLSFLLNGQSQGVAYDTLPSGNYCLAVSMPTDGQVSFVSEQSTQPYPPPLEHLLQLYERLFARQDKDVCFELQDGEERAHAVVLCSASDVFEQMLCHDMKERRTGTIKLPEFSRISMSVFLRLIYTGQLNVQEWNESESSSTPESIPLEILVDLVALAKKYISHIQSGALEVLKARLSAAKDSKDTVTFQRIFQAGIHLDLVPLNLAALVLAKDFQSLHEQFNERRLHAEVLHALEAIWPATPPLKRRHLFP